MNERKYSMYLLFDKRGTPIMPTLHYQKKLCVLSYFRSYSDYQDARKKIGWECRKVEITVKIP